MVTAVHTALEAENVNLILPYVPEDSAAEVKSAFEKVLQADLHFFETVARPIPGLGRGK